MEPITKIYRIMVQGYDESRAVFDAINADFERTKKQKLDLDKALSKTVDASKIADYTKRIKELSIAQAELSTKLAIANKEMQISQAFENNPEGDGIGSALRAYVDLNNQYKEAKENLQQITEEFGAESVQAKEATAALAGYEAELIKINALRGKNFTPKYAVPAETTAPNTTVAKPPIVSQPPVDTTGLELVQKLQLQGILTNEEYLNSFSKFSPVVNQAAQSTKEIQLSLDQYTGALKDNIVQQIKNTETLAANKTQQKELLAAMRENGGGTGEKVSQLATLQQDAILLSQTNKDLTVTIRNQAKEYLSAEGAISEYRAKVNLLQQAFIKLSEADKSASVGQNIKAQIDELEPKLKAMEASIGLFQRNVGNYPTTPFAGASAAINSALAQSQAKIVSGDFAGPELADLTQKTAVLKTVTDQLSASFKSSSAEQAAYKEAVRQVGAEFGTESEVFKNFTKEVAQGNNQLKEADAALKQAGESGGGFLDNFKSQAVGILSTYIGIQAVFQGVISGINTVKELSDQTTNLEVEFGKTAGGARKLVDQLAKLNTRTPLTELENIANIAAKAGVSEENLVGVTEALDKIKIAFGKDFGDVETGTESLVKLINVFEGTDKVTGENLLKAGNAVRTLANETVASVPYLNDFSKRMAGLKGISDISLPAVLGLASGFEQFGQSSEVAGTTLTRVIPKLATDTAKYAEIAGLTQQAFADLLKNNPAEALIKVSEGLVKGKAGIEEISTAFADSNLGSGRIAAILGTVGAKADDFRKAIASAGTAYNDTANIETAFAAKNENLAATFDKISKSLADAANSTAFRLTLTAIAGVISLLIGNIGILAGVLAVLATGWAIANAEMIKTRIITLASNIAFQAQYATIVIGELITKSYATAVTLLNSAFLRTAASSAILRTAISLLAGPVGIVIAIIGLLAIGTLAFGRAVDASVGSIKELIRQQQIANEITQKANSQIAEQTSVLAGWVAVIKSAATSADTKRAALQKLIDINPAFREALNGQVIDLQKLDAVYKQVTESIRANAEATVAAQLSAEKQKDVLSVTSVKQQLETEFSRTSGPVRTIGGFSEDELKKLMAGIDAQNNSIRLTGNGSIQFTEADYAKIQGNLKRQEDVAIGVYQNYLKAQAATQAKLADMEAKAQEGQNKNAETVSKGFQVDIALLKSQIDGLDKQIEVFQGSQKDLTALITKRSNLQDQLDKAIGTYNNKKAKTPQAATLTASDKDELALEDARKDLLLTQENLTKQSDKQGLISEETYLNNILKINVDSIDRKLALIKGGNAKEMLLRAQLQLQRVTLEQETANKIFTIQETSLKNDLDGQISGIKEKDRKVQEDPNSTNVEKSQSTVDADNAIIDAQEIFNDEMNKLARELNQSTLKINKEGSDALKKEIDDRNKALNQAAEARLKDVSAQGEKDITLINLQYEPQRKAILDNEKLTSEQRTKLLERLASANNITILSAELTTLNDQLKEKWQLLLKGLASDEEYLKLSLAAKKKASDLQAAVDAAAKKKHDDAIKDKPTTVEGLTAGAIAQGLGYDKDSPEAQIIGKETAQAFSLASDAMHSYYDAERQRIQQSLDLNLQRLDLEEEQVKARAQSQEEIDGIDKEYAQKKKDAQKQAGEEIKKTKRAELKIALVTELANDAVAAAAYPFPFNLGIFAVMAGLATARYAVGLGQINAQQFEYGGVVERFANGGVLDEEEQKRKPRRLFAFGGKVTEDEEEKRRRRKEKFAFGGEVARNHRGGIAKGRPHSGGGNPFLFKGVTYEDEVEELRIIRTKNAPKTGNYTISGNHHQIASALNKIGGGVEFAPGAKTQKFAMGGYIGDNLQAPVFQPSSLSSSISKSDLSEVVNELKELKSGTQKAADETSKRIDKIQVVQVTSTVKKALAKEVKQKNVGTM